MLRRALLAGLIAAISTPQAWAHGAPSPIVAWLQTIAELRDALAAGEID